MFNVEDFQKSSAAYYSHTKDAKTEVKIFYTYKGMPVNPQFVDEYPELYPSKEQIQKKYEELRSITHKGKTSFFTVTEDGLQDIQLNVLSDSLIELF
jgi:hypothetical protein